MNDILNTIFLIDRTSYLVEDFFIERGYINHGDDVYEISGKIFEAVRCKTDGLDIGDVQLYKLVESSFETETEEIIQKKK